MNMAGIIFSNLFDENFGLLTKNRTVASIPFGGRYRLIDFILSNMSNSSVNNIGIITKYNYNSLMDHLGSFSSWDLNRKNGGIYLIPPFSMGRMKVYHGKIEALFSALPYLEKAGRDYVLLADSTVVCNIDFEKALASHKKSGKDLTIIANNVPVNESFHYPLLIETENKKVKHLYLDYPKSQENALASMDIYIMDKEKLCKAIYDSASKGLHHLERDFFLPMFNSGKLSINVYEFKGRVLRNHSIKDYFKNNFDLISDESLRDDIFSQERPIYTKVRDEVPTFYEKGSSVSDCIVADGSKISGHLENSVIFRDVKIKKGAFIKNSIIMQGSIIEEDCFIENTIVDKDVTISKGTRLEGAKNAPLILEKGERI